MTVSIYGDDADSLFGSPPPSPVRGGSPGLALPTSIGFSRDSENVGTIALPGSHNCSELPVILPASPPRLNAASKFPETRTPSPTPLSRQLSPCARPPRKAKPKALKTSSAPPRPQAPPLVMPEDGTSVPPGFLRNQTGLLGVAGIVGGVRPGKNPQVTRRGSSADNPIIVEDPLTNPVPITKRPRPYQAFKADILPRPPPEEVLNSLINQKNIFPVLKSILLHLSGQVTEGSMRNSSAFYRPSGFARQSQLEPVAKKRKLNAVPAGAVDWDVPFPFMDSSGPSDYRTTWQRDRGKQLMKQLIALLQDAVHKASTKTQARARPKVGKPRKWTTSSSNTSSVSGDQQRCDIVEDLQPSVSSQSSVTEQQVSTSFNQLLASLSAAQLETSGPSQVNAADVADDSLRGASNLQSDIRSWLNDINSEPLDNDIQCLSMPEILVDSVNSPTATSSSRLPTPVDHNLNCSKVGVSNPERAQVPVSSMATTSASPVAHLSAAHRDYASPSLSVCYDSMIDPVLLALSGSCTAPNSVVLRDSSSESIPPDVGIDQLSFNCSAGTIESGRMFNDSPPQNINCSAQEHALPTSMANFTSHDPTDCTPASSCTTIPILSGQFLTASATPPCREAQVQKSGNSEDAMTDIASSDRPTDNESIIYAASAEPIFTNLRSPPTRMSGNTVSQREDILRRTMDQRRQLREEIARVNVNLWETSIEQAVLVHMLKDAELPL